MDFQFYPTPPDLAYRAWKKFQTTISRVLEPSAGNGDLLQNHPFETQWGRRGAPPIDCCEIDISKHAVLRSRGFNVVGVDFLQYASGAHYSHIILNPPFTDGAKHALKAWDILWDGEIVAILNAETVRNPFSKERQRLAMLIEEHGDVEFIANAFTVQEAERKTEVEVALVYLRKTARADEIVGDLLSELRRETDGDGLAAEYREANAVALPNSVIENAVIAFNAATQSMRDSVFSEARAAYYASLLGATMAARNGDTGNDVPKLSPEWVQDQIGKRYLELKDRAWANILRSTNVTSRLSSTAQKRLESEFEQIKQLEFTVSNVFGFLSGLAGNQGKIQMDMACDVFDTITRYHSNNTCWYKGWRSNDKHRSAGMRIRTTRFILPGHSINSWSTSMSWDSERLLSDFDKVFAMMDGGKQAPDVGLVQVFREQFAELKAGERVSSSYFDVRWFPGAGTIHFYANDKKLVDRLNRLVGRLRKWLPPTDAGVPEAFWLQYEKAEKLDKEVRDEINRAHREKKGSWWDHPLDKLHRPHEESALAWAAVDSAITSVLEKHGISTDYQIEAPDQSRAQLPLLAAA